RVANERAAIERVAARVGERLPIGARVVDIDLLPVEGRCDRQIVGGVVGHRDVHGADVVEVRARLFDIAGGPIDAIDVAAIMSVRGAGAHAEYSVDQRHVDCGTDFLGRIASLGKGEVATCVDVKLGSAGLRRDEADGAAFRAGTEQRALWSAQYLDALEVEDLRPDAAAQAAERGTVLDRGIVDVDTGCAGTRIRCDAADGDVGYGARVVAVARELHARRHLGDVVDLADVVLVERLL